MEREKTKENNEMICFKLLLAFIMSISCIGCTSNKTSSNEIVESSINTKDDSITVEYNDDFSWNISGNGSFELLILNCNDSQLDERLSKKNTIYQITKKLHYHFLSMKT